jgi:hypothetical protein
MGVDAIIEAGLPDRDRALHHVEVDVQQRLDKWPGCDLALRCGPQVIGCDNLVPYWTLVRHLHCKG